MKKKNERADKRREKKRINVRVAYYLPSQRKLKHHEMKREKKEFGEEEEETTATTTHRASEQEN